MTSEEAFNEFLKEEDCDVSDPEEAWKGWAACERLFQLIDAEEGK